MSPKKTGTKKVTGSFESRLKKLNKSWKDATNEEDPFGAQVDDGFYKMKVMEGRVEEAQSSGRLQIRWEHQILEGEFKGETVLEYEGLEQEQSLFYVQRRISRLGYDIPEDISELQAVLEKITKEQPVARCKVATKDDFQHVYIQRSLSNEPAVETTGSDEEPPDGGGDEELAVGDTVKFESDEGELTGKITSINSDSEEANVETSDGEYEVDVSLLTKVEEAEPAPDEETAGFEKDDQVTFDDEGKEVTAKVVSVSEDTALVEDSNEDQYEVPLEMLTKVEAGEGAAEEPAEIEEGSEVSFTDEEGNALAGTVSKIDGDDIEVTVGDNVYTCEADELSLVGNEEEAEIDVGSKIGWMYKGKELTGKVTELMDNGVRAKRDDNGRITVVTDGDYYAV